MIDKKMEAVYSAIIFDLAKIKDELTETGEPDLDDTDHERWLMDTWDDFDALPVSYVYDDLGELARNLIDGMPTGSTVGDFYDLICSLLEEV